MNQPILHPQEATSNAVRQTIASVEPRALRTFTPSLAVLDRARGIFLWTPEGRRLYDLTSGVLVANLGHNPRDWLARLCGYLGWKHQCGDDEASGFVESVPLTAYNGTTSLEAEASRRLIDLLRSRPGGQRCEQVMWAASGSEAVQKALWAALARDRNRDIILATRFGFHGKKGLAGATTGSESDPDRDPRVRFISFPMAECNDVSDRQRSFDPLPYQQELDGLKREYGRRLNVLITEPYLGGGGSYHPPREYLQLLQSFCRDNDIVFILDEVQSNFGRTGSWFAYESYGLEPDIVVLGKGLANGIPGAAAVGRADLFDHLDYGEGSDTYSGNPLTCAAVLATLDCFQATDVLEHARRVSPIVETGLIELKELPFVSAVRGEAGGMVWGVEIADHNDRPAFEMANACVLACYRGRDHTGIHLLGPLARKVLRVAPPLVITEAEAKAALALMRQLFETAPTIKP